MAWSVGCSVEGCRGKAKRRTNLRIHFMHHHVQDTIVILEEVNYPHPHCLACDMFVTRVSLNQCQLRTFLCARIAG